MIENSYARYGSIFYIIENYKSYVSIEKCELKDNFGEISLFDFGQANLNISDSLIINNKNNLFRLVSSTFILTNSTIINQICFNKFTGCAISGADNSIMWIIQTKFENISSEIEEGNIYLENSDLIMETTVMNLLNTKRKQGDCFSLYSSSTLALFRSSFSKYNFNCLYSMQSQINIMESKFNNSEYSEKLIEYKSFGAIYCFECKYLLISDSYFVKNTHVIDGSSLYAISKRNDVLGEIKIQKCFFIDNEAREKGTIYIYNQNFSITYTIFENNSAKIGGAIFINNDGKIKKISLN